MNLHILVTEIQENLNKQDEVYFFYVNDQKVGGIQHGATKNSK